MTKKKTKAGKLEALEAEVLARVHVPSVRVTIRETGDAMTSPDGGEYFETCYELRASNQREFRTALEVFAKGLGAGHDPKANRFVAFIGIGRTR